MSVGAWLCCDGGRNLLNDGLARSTREGTPLHVPLVAVGVRTSWQVGNKSPICLTTYIPRPSAGGG